MINQLLPSARGFLLPFLSLFSLFTARPNLGPGYIDTVLELHVLMANALLFIIMFSFCLKACKTTSRTVSKDNDDRPSIDSTASLSKYKGCTEIDGNLNIRIRGTASSGNFVILFWLFVTTATLNLNNPLTTKSNYVKISIPTYQRLMNNHGRTINNFLTTYRKPTNNLPNNLPTPNTDN